MKLRLISISYEHHDALAVLVPTEVEDRWRSMGAFHGGPRQKIVFALLNNYPHKLIFWSGLAVEFEVPEEASAVLEHLHDLKKPIREKDAEEVLQNPTLERVERFVALRKLLE